jgi:hypothetical protein
MTAPKLDPDALEKAREMYAATIKGGHSLTIREFRESQDKALKAALLAYEANRKVSEEEVERGAIAISGLNTHGWHLIKERLRDETRQLARACLLAARGSRTGG